jgi:hypothetical protein
MPGPRCVRGVIGAEGVRVGRINARLNTMCATCFLLPNMRNDATNSTRVCFYTDDNALLSAANAKGPKAHGKRIGKPP